MKVKYASKWYEVAMVQENFGQKWYEIYDEPDTNPEHTDWITHPDEVIEDENTREEFKEKIELTEADKKLQCLEYIREKTGCGLGLISKCFETLIENLKNKPQNKMDVGLSLKMEWQEYDLRNQ